MKTIIFSLDTADRQPPSDEYDTMREHLLTGKIMVNNSEGYYKGNKEKSFICLLETELQEQMILGIAHAYKQECVLEVELPSRMGYLRYFDGSPRKALGMWKEAPLDVKDDFTLNLETMKIYTCLPIDTAAAVG
jgi:hypothetical protein